MEAIKKQRRVMRAAFTKAYTAFMAFIEHADSTREQKTVAFQLLETKMAELDAVHTQYNQLLCKSELTDEDVAKEMESDDTYKTNYLTAKMKMTNWLGSIQETQRAPARSVTAPREVKTRRLPKIELPKFNGSVKEWLPFWSQFKKYHDDDSIDSEDKFQYLLQCIVPDSRASEVVNSYPPTGANYEKVILSLKNRFGRDDLVVEFYVRELLGLVLQNVTSGKKKPSLGTLYDKLEASMRALETLGVTTDKCAAMLYPLVESSLPEDVLRAWQRNGHRVDAEANEENNDTNDQLSKLLKFLQLEVENEERIDMAATGFGLQAAEQEKSRKQRGKTEPSRDVASASVLLVKKDKSAECIFCKSSHESHECVSARKLSSEERKEIVKNSHVCFNCLKQGHISRRCRVKVKCDWCAGHHVLLMCNNLSQKENVDSRERSEKTESVKKTESENNLATFAGSPAVCLQTLRIRLFSETREKTVRAVIDTASQRSYIRSDIAKELRYESIGKQEVTHSLFGGVKSKSEKHDIFLIRAKDLSDTYRCNFKVMSQRTICDTVPTIKSAAWMNELRENNISLSDVGGVTENIDVLIGADVAGKLFTGKRFALKNDLVAFETFLGWTIMGKLPNEYNKNSTAIMVTTLFVKEANLNELWNLDVLGITDPIIKLQKSVRDGRTMDFLTKTAQLNVDRRYEVRLPWVENHAPVSSNYGIARSRLEKSVGNLKRQNLFYAYDEIFKEWLTEGIIERVPENELNKFAHYLPHRPVVKAQGTTKIRPVFDASARAEGYPSLNQCLEKGPNLIEIIPSSINRFREGEIGVVSDIRKAFLQISINESDRDFLRFLWMENDNMIVFRHCRVVFGLACSPFLLAAVIILLLNEALRKCKNESCTEWSEETIEKLRKSFYVDNCIASLNTEHELEKFVRESTEVMRSGGFDLRGWESSGDTSENESTLVLGLLWNKRKDSLSINPTMLNIEIPETVTKRIILSATHRVFDPIGVTSPVSLQPKLLLQKLWGEQIDWDTKIEGERRDEFLSWLGDLKNLNKIEIPRKLDSGELTLHVFGDASGSAYATVIYARVVGKNGISVNLLSAKSRVAPKGGTIPRLELMGATIAVRLASTILESLTRKIDRVTYWTDSTTVLAWVRRDMQWSTFVWNRVKEIRSLSKESDWRYVPTHLNPADLPSRGCNSSQLRESKWWCGPSWLREPESKWPTTIVEYDEEEVREEVKKGAAVNMVDLDHRPFEVSDHFSSYTKLIRFAAWMQRFVSKCKSAITKRKSGEKVNNPDKLELQKMGLTFKEMRSAENKLLKYLQNQMLKNELKDKLTSFKTILNNDGLLVLKTKIFNRVDDPKFICPIVLDSNHEIVYMFVREVHERLGHVGAGVVMSNIREKFWIIALRRLIRKIEAKCLVCKRQKAKHADSETPPLPQDRVRDAAIFEVVGIDFAGPIFIKGGGKGWICMFTCAVYRAVHLELASSLSVEGFIQCFRRFIARRGRPRSVYSDNGTNFTGTARALRDLDWARIAKFSTVSQIEWHFNPPAAPWWGGWWERLIGVLKTILRKVLGRASLSYESLTTTLCDAEAIINARPLTYLSDDPSDLKPLTPSMFLQEIHEVGIPDCDMLYNVKLNKRFKYKQKILEDLRKRFRSEYLGQLLLKERKKTIREVKVGEIVLVENETKKRLDWPLALVLDVIPGRDGTSRVIILKTKNGILKRPIQRVYPLEVAQSEPELIKAMKEQVNNKKIVKDLTRKNDLVVDKSNAHDDLNKHDVKIVATRSGRVVKTPERYCA